MSRQGEWNIRQQHSYEHSSSMASFRNNKLAEITLTDETGNPSCGSGEVLRGVRGQHWRGWCRRLPGVLLLRVVCTELAVAVAAAAAAACARPRGACWRECQPSTTAARAAAAGVPLASCPGRAYHSRRAATCTPIR